MHRICSRPLGCRISAQSGPTRAVARALTEPKALAEGCDLLIIPTVPATLDTEGLVLTIEALSEIPGARYRVLLTKVPPPPEQDGKLLRMELERQGIPIFKAEIPRTEGI
jgi:hypothetical protein